MNAPMVFALPGNEPMAASVTSALEAEPGLLEIRQFPDGESYVRYKSDPSGRSIILVCTLDRPDAKFLRLAFAAAAARDLNAARVGLVAPYLAYMRQDRRFHPGEAITSATFADLLSTFFDWFVTVDPHLHRYAGLDAIYSIPAGVVHAAPMLADWISAQVTRPLLIGPDVESEQWVSKVAGRIGAPYRVLRKTRFGDRNVRVAVPDLGSFAGHTPVLIDDIVSSGRTMIETLAQLRDQGLKQPVCAAVHGLFSDEAFTELTAGAAVVVTTNSVPHSSNRIDLSVMIAKAAAEFI